MLIVADDLTGAADCSVACAAAGLNATVLLGRDLEFDFAEADVMAVDADTRRMSAAESAAVTEQVVRDHMRGEQRLLYKKLDSTLRGHWGTELRACLKVLREVRTRSADAARGFAVIAPAFPKIGRTTIAGQQFVHGIPLEETEIWKREGIAGSAHLAEMLLMSDMKAEAVGLDTVRSGQQTLRYILAELGRDRDAVICDAETDEDLRAIALASLELHPAVMWAGSAGLAHQLLQVAGFSSKERTRQTSESILHGATLFVVGSPSSVSQAQVEALLQDGDIQNIRVSSGALCSTENSWDWSADQLTISDAFRKRHDVLVQLGGKENVDSRRGRLLAAAIAKLIEPCSDEIGALVLTGGETAREVLDTLGARRLRLMGEVEPGLPFSMTEGWKRRLPVLTKAGAFGDSQSLVRCRHFLRRFGSK